MFFYFSALIFNTKVRIQIHWNTKNFATWQPKENLTKYKLSVVEAFLHVDCVMPSSKLRVEIDRHFSKLPINYHYRGKKKTCLLFSWSIKAFFAEIIAGRDTITTGTNLFSSGNLMKLNKPPLKIWVCFVIADAFNGHR